MCTVDGSSNRTEFIIPNHYNSSVNAVTYQTSKNPSILRHCIKHAVNKLYTNCILVMEDN